MATWKIEWKRPDGLMAREDVSADGIEHDEHFTLFTRNVGGQVVKAVRTSAVVQITLDE